MSRPYVVVDVETTGLDPDRDHVWELTVGGLDDALAALGLEANPAAHTAYADADSASRVYHHLMFGDR